MIEGQTSGHTIWVNRAPEAKTVKNRVHLDIYTRSLEDLEALGAVMADPEGNEFCVFGE